MSSLDKKIEEALNTLREEKYRLRTFQVILRLEIDSDKGVEESMQAIRAIEGVTVVTALDSNYDESRGVYTSKVKVKFHPNRDTTPPTKYINQTLLPSIRSRKLSGVKYITRSEPERTS
jgi:hypothetical protein